MLSGGGRSMQGVLICAAASGSYCACDAGFGSRALLRA